MNTFGKLCFLLMAAMPVLMEAGVLTDREQETSIRYWWYVAPAALGLLAAIAVGVPGVPKELGGLLCLCTMIFTRVNTDVDEIESAETGHGKLIYASEFCAIAGMICWCLSQL